MSLETYADRIRRLPETGKLTKEDLLVPEFLLEQEGELSMYYAPHNEVVNEGAQLVLIGITPGWTQMELAFRSVRDDLRSGKVTLREAEERAKRAAGLAGPMRCNVVQLLDRCGMHTAMGLSSTASLFEERRELLHTTAVIKYPVFVKGVNYTGHQPPVGRSALLQRYAYEVLPTELKRLHKVKLWVPMGQAVSEVLTELAERGVVDRERCLLGFPHPSGANAHRHKQLEERREDFTSRIRKVWP
ncbi:hypothetical protein RAC89_06825 [Paenibacillus sp. GD4]|uniref:hypothetical protein n=1 Tax=Paenibacillus sp. GD4 TaxID=3068890 RepID=UPI002796C693|nr:hypothetical protein [Paenibacillus sp. GD4]MDQ1910210.1 hypothetical protein [Paenibacillus sp. GD4]